MRIALTAPEYPGCGPAYGVARYIATLAAALRDAGCAVRVVAATADGVFVEDAPGGLARASAVRVPAAARALATAPAVARALRAFAPTVVEHASWGGLGARDDGPWARVARLSTPVAAIPAVDPLRRLARRAHHALERATVRRAHVVIADSAAVDAAARRWYGRGADVVIPHAWRGPIAAPTPATRAALFVGRIEPRKGIDVLLAAWPAVRAALPDATLHVVGAERGPFAATLPRAVPGVERHGALDDAALGELRRRCSVAVVPSRFESFGLVALEAWASGHALVASAAGALPEVVGDAGVLVPPDDAAALASALAALLGDPGRARALASSGAARLRARFAPDAYARDTLAAYARALERRR